MGTDREILFHEICVSWKQMLGIDKKTIFPVKKYLPIKSMIFSCSENSEHPWWSTKFFSQYTFSWNSAFLVVFYLSAYDQRSALFEIKINYMLYSKTIECLSMPLVTHKEGGFSLFRLLLEVVFS